MANPTCPYCSKLATTATGKQKYPHRRDLWHKRFFECVDCDAYVGCHPDGRPLGRLANAQLRAAKIAAHAAFDKVWRSGLMSRSSAYKWLASRLGLSPQECHIGMFDIDLCNRVKEVRRGEEASGKPEGAKNPRRG